MRRRALGGRVALALLSGAVTTLALGACADDESTAGAPPIVTSMGGSGATAGTGGAPSGGAGGVAGQAGAGGSYDECVVGEAICLSHDSTRRCESTDSGARYVDEICADGSGCLLGECVVGQCSDECTLGQQSGGQSCELLDITNGAWGQTDQASSLHDRSREYLRWLRRDGMLHGGVGAARYADTSYAQVTSLDGMGDSAIWTGTYLAAEAMRLMVTGAPDARDHVIDGVQTLHLWFNVDGQPGLLARWVKPSDEPLPFTVGDMNCAAERVHCGVAYEGESYDYIGHISRDQYQGVLLGYSLAYDALGPADEPARELIRQDVVELLDELMTERTVPLSATIDGTTWPTAQVHMRFVVLAPRETDQGALRITLDTGDVNASEMYGFQEFIPNLKDLLGQIPVIGPILPTIPRPDSAVMLSSFFRVGMQVTDGVPGYEAAHDRIADYYDNHDGSGGNVDDWLGIASFAYYPEPECGNSYFGNNIMMEPMYNLARLEDDAGRLAVIRDDVLGGWLWDRFVNTKNTFFSFIYASNVPGHAANVPVLAADQLRGFPLAPRVQVHVDLTADPDYMPHETGCPSEQCNHDTAVDVAERPWADFMWQRHPWGLTANEDLTKTAPGIDYLVAYWMGRLHGYFDEDTAGRCAAWH